MSVMVFGVFDGLHDGHTYFLEQAKKRGDLIIVVARNSVVHKLKNKTPKHTEQERIEAIKEFLPEAEVAQGDMEQGSYEVVKKHQPDMICLGYDQGTLGRDLRAKIADGTLPAITLVELPHHDLN